MIGWVKVHRKLSEKAFYKKDSEKVHLWIHLLISASRGEREEILGGKPIKCSPGQFTTGRKQLSEDTGINESKIERILTYFEKIEQQIEQQKTSTNRLISILKWNEYQINEQQNEQLPNNDRTTSEHTTRSKRIKELKNKEYAENLNEFSSLFFESKYVNEKSLFMFDVLLLEFPIEKIKEAIENAKSDNFWTNQFLSPLKLKAKNKEGVLYIDKFLSLKSRNNGKDQHNNSAEKLKEQFADRIKTTMGNRDFE
jgi:hypothetical protein